MRTRKLYFKLQKEPPKIVIFKGENRRSFIAKIKNTKLGYRKGFIRWNKKYWELR